MVFYTCVCCRWLYCAHKLYKLAPIRHRQDKCGDTMGRAGQAQHHSDNNNTVQTLLELTADSLHIFPARRYNRCAWHIEAEWGLQSYFPPLPFRCVHVLLQDKKHTQSRFCFAACHCLNKMVPLTYFGETLEPSTLTSACLSCAMPGMASQVSHKRASEGLAECNSLMCFSFRLYTACGGNLEREWLGLRQDGYGLTHAL